MNPSPFATTTACLLSFAALSAQAGGVPADILEEVVVTGQLHRLQGAPVSASQGIVTAEQLALRPVLRNGELLEVVPGLIVTQHAGSGKANQYFLRGFNLDHGTDLATSVDGVPVNLPTHAHGQGYTDINFVIPELVESIDYRKGTYYADSGNFSAAGAVNMRYRQRLDAPLLALETDRDSYRRGLLAASPALGQGTLLLALDSSRNDGPWLLEENFHKTSGLLRYSRPHGDSRFSVTAQGYDGDWRSTDQIPLRAVRSGQLNRYGAVDPSDAGASHRYSLSADWTSPLGSGAQRTLLYAVDYELDLFSNFSYFTDPVNGDQFEQLDARRVYGGELSWQGVANLAGHEHELTSGLQVRHDDIDSVGLYRSVARRRIGTVREDTVKQTSYGVHASVTTRWFERLRTTLGLRADRFDFDVSAGLSENSGTAHDTLLSPKLSLVLGPWQRTELFLNLGNGFHSNDARGTTIRVDPNDGTTPLTRVAPLARAAGMDLGLRTAILSDLQLSLSGWALELDSELVFVGDAGITEPSRASRRRGLELSAIWNPLQWLLVDADLAWSRARFAGNDPAGDHIAGAVEKVASLGVAVDHPRGWFAGARLRHLGPAPLLEDDSVRSSATTLVNLEVGRRIGESWKLSAALYNVFDRKDNDITYYYESQLRGEAQPVSDIHFHPVEPRTLRLTITTTL